MRTTLDQAMIRWSVVHREWHEAANDMPVLGAFLAGWYWRENCGFFAPAGVDSFRYGIRKVHPVPKPS